ncbi:MAG TPA: chloride channel protein [Chitinophagales bacterium]|nr:chloride channel protein [Chitinophagales bacterium]
MENQTRAKNKQPIKVDKVLVHLENYLPRQQPKRLFFITGLAFINAIAAGFIAKGLIKLIDFFTNLSFYGRFSAGSVSPAGNHLGCWVLLVPVIGGLIVGVMARFGSAAIRGHGIPEAMEKILTDDSNIPPLVTLLKPLSSAISIGTGGPFGAEGPIIATGGALGSLCGQTLHTTPFERKVLLSAGATAGMAAIFGTPFAAILLAIELLLFELAPKSFIPVMVACVTGACMHFLFFGMQPVFPMPKVSTPGGNEIMACAIIGLLVGLASIVVTRSIYLIEDAFEHLPVHWMWWPAIGGVAVGLIGYFAPHTLGVGYENITNALSGNLTVSVLLALCLAKFLSWAISLGSGTSGGTLAPLLTMGSALGCMLGLGFQMIAPQLNISLPVAACVGMAALFAGASRALLTSVVFALEATGQQNILLPLIAGSVSSYIVSFILMKNTIMTEKISRRGVVAPDSYVPDMLQTTLVEDVMADGDGGESIPLISAENTIGEVQHWLVGEGINYPFKTLLIIDTGQQSILGFVSKDEIALSQLNACEKITALLVPKIYSVYADNKLEIAVHTMLKTNLDILPVINRSDKTLSGSVSYNNIFKAYKERFRIEHTRHRHISARKALKVIVRGKQLFRAPL